MTNFVGKTIFVSFLLFSLSLLSGCGDGSDKFAGEVRDEDEESLQLFLNGGAVKGPLINASVTAYSVDVEDKDFVRSANADLGFRRVLDSVGVSYESGTVSVSGGGQENLVSSIRNLLAQTSYVSNIVRLQTVIDETSSLSEAKQCLDAYFGVSSEEEGAADDEGSTDNTLCDSELLETNSIALDKVKNATNSYSTFEDLKESIANVETLVEELVGASSFSQLKSSIRTFQQAESSDEKQGYWANRLLKVEELEKYQSKLSSLKEDFTKLYNYLSRLSAVQKETNLVALSRLESLRTNIEDSNSVEDFEALLAEAAVKEGLSSVRNALRAFQNSIVAFDDIESIFSVDEAVHGSNVLHVFTSCSDALVCVEDTVLSLSSEKRESFEALLVSEKNVSNVPENRLSFGISDEFGIVEGLTLGDYEGFVYLRTLITEETADLNGGSSHIFDSLDLILHTDDIKGYGNNAQFDETIYYYLNGVLQVNSDGELITDREEITSSAEDDVIAVFPHRLATPWSKLSLSLALENMSAGDIVESPAPLSELIELSAAAPSESVIVPTSLESVYSLGEYLSLNITDALSLNDHFRRSRSIVSDALNISEVDFGEFDSVSPLLLSHMKIETEKVRETLALRANIEYLGAVISLLSADAKVSTNDVFNALVLDLKDKLIDGKDGLSDLPVLSSNDKFKALFNLNPDQINIPGTMISVADIDQLVRLQFESLLPQENISDFPVLQEIDYEKPALGVDSDEDGIFDKFDPAPFDSNVEEETQVGVAEIRVVNAEAIMPFSGGIYEEFFVVAVEGESVCPSRESSYKNLDLCVAVNDLDTEFSAEASVVTGADVESLEVDVAVLPPGNGLGKRLALSLAGGVPGEYKVALNVIDSVLSRTLTEIITITVMDARELELALISPEDEQLDANALTSNIEGRVEFVATQAICDAYDFCTSEDVEKSYDVSLLGDALKLDWSLQGEDSSSGYTVVNVVGNNGVSNIGAYDQLSVSVSFDSEDIRYEVDSLVDRVGAELDDLFPAHNNCSSVFDGIENPEEYGIKGPSVGVEPSPCFSDLVSEPENLKLVISMPNEFQETWFYDLGWGIVIRLGTDGAFLGALELPKDELDNFVQLSSVYMIDELNRRLYLSTNENIVYYDFGTRELKTFVEEGGAEALTGLFGLVFIDRTSESEVYDLDGNQIYLNAGRSYPEPNHSIPLLLGERFLEDFAGEVEVSATYIGGNREADVFPSEVTLNQATKSIPAGATQLGDVIRIDLHYTNSAQTTKTISEELYILGLADFVLSGTEITSEDAITILSGSKDVLGEEIDELVSAEWYKLDPSTNKRVFIAESKKSPFTLESSLTGSGEYYIAQMKLEVEGVDSQSFVLEEVGVLVYDNFRNDFIKNELSIQSSVVDPATGSSATVLQGSDFFNTVLELGLINIQWALNGEDVAGENSLKFPSQVGVASKIGDELSYHIGGSFNEFTSNTIQGTVTTSELDAENSVVALTPIVAEIGESISLDLSAYNETKLTEFRFEWLINGVVDGDEEGISYPADKLSYGDKVELRLIEGENAVDSVGVAFVGVNSMAVADGMSGNGMVIDSDGDGVPNSRDYFRYDANCWAKQAGSPDDIDGDGLADLDELRGPQISFPSVFDSDNDGLSDFYEVTGINVFGSTVNTSNPMLTDTDGDGYSDFVESQLGTNPNVASIINVSDDADFDGLTNTDESSNGSLVFNSDTDADDLVDGVDPSPTNPDADEDGLSDGLEVLVLNTDPNTKDSDSDGLSDSYEFLVSRTNPNLADNSSGEDHVEYTPSNLINVSDAGQYNYLDREIVEPGSCYVSLLASKTNLVSAASDNNQEVDGADRYILWGSPDWSFLLVYDVKESLFMNPVDLSSGGLGKFSSVAFKDGSLNEFYVGFTNGLIYEGDLSVNSDVSLVIMSDDSQAVDYISDANGPLVTITNGEKSIISVPEKSVRLELDSLLSIDSIIWAEDSNKYWSLTDSRELLSFAYDESSNSILTNQFNFGLIDAPASFYLDSSENRLIFSNNASFDLSSEAVDTFDSVTQGFSSGISAGDQHARLINSGNALQILTARAGTSQFSWTMVHDFNQLTIEQVLLSGSEILLVAHNSSEARFEFYSLPFLDADANQIPDWWQTIVVGGTLAHFENETLPDTVALSDFNKDQYLVNTGASEDFDGDGISNEIEQQLGSCSGFGGITCLNSLDSDGDGLSDYYEYFEIIDPSVADINDLIALVTKSDADDDGVSDYEEVNTYQTNPLLQDSDGDLICDAFEINLLGTSPILGDTDSDNLNDGIELGIEALSCDQLTVDKFSDPLLADSDKDGLDDLREYNYVAPDSDRKLDAFSTDTDGDGFTDGDEMARLAANASGASYAQGINPTTADALDGGVPVDTDGDGLADAFELNRSFTSIHLADTDGDGLTDYEESTVIGSNPNQIDSDGDSVCDYFDRSVLTDQERDAGFIALSVEQYKELDVIYSLLVLVNTSDFVSSLSLLLTASNIVDNNAEEYLPLLSDDLISLNFAALSSSERQLLIDQKSDIASSQEGAALIASESVIEEIKRIIDGENIDHTFVSLSNISQDQISTYFGYLGEGHQALLGANAVTVAKFYSQRVILNTNVVSKDSDLDLFDDGYELGLDGLAINCSAIDVSNLVAIPIALNSDDDELTDTYELNSSNDYAGYTSDDFKRYPDLKIKLDPLLGDTDSDGICDTHEVNNIGSNPAEADTDLDTLVDSWELGASVACDEPWPGITANTSLVNADSDQDGLTDAQERGGLAGAIKSDTDPNDPDSNDNGILDGDEDIDGDGLSNSAEFNSTGTRFDIADSDGDGVNDYNEDSDQDGLSNGVEVANGSCSIADLARCPDPVDSDGDGISDYEEVRLADEGGYTSNPLESDSDGDTITDLDEITRVARFEYEICFIEAVNNGLIEFGGEESSVACPVNPNEEDSDFDGLPDSEEINRGTDPNHPDTDRDFLADGDDDFPLIADADGDGIIDGIEEYVLNTDPNNSFTDSDRLTDGQEVWVYALDLNSSEDGALYNAGLVRSVSGGDVVVDSRHGDANWGGEPLDIETLDRANVEEGDGIKTVSIYHSTIEQENDDGSTDVVTVYGASRNVYYLHPVSLNESTGELNDSVIGGSEGAVAKLYVQIFSDPMSRDSDNDSLADDVELLKIEARYGSSSFVGFEFDFPQEPRSLSCINTDYDEIDIPVQGVFDPDLSNSQLFSISNPLDGDTDKDGVSDGNEDADRDYLSNVLDAAISLDSVIVSDLDKDCLLDGIEELVLNSFTQSTDTDLDGLLDSQEVNESLIENVRLVSSGELGVQIEPCLGSEIRIDSAEPNMDYCVSYVFNSNPVKLDTDGDNLKASDETSLKDALPGISTGEGDYFPLDDACFRLSDGVVDTENLANSYCYASWISQQDAVEDVISARWQDGGNFVNYFAFYSKSWDRLVQLYMNSDDDGEFIYVPHIELQDTLSVEASSDLRRVYIANTDGSIDYLDLNTNTLVESHIANIGTDLVISDLITIGNRLLVQALDSVNGGYSRYLYDAAGALTDSSSALSEIELSQNAVICDGDVCGSNASVYGVSGNGLGNEVVVGVTNIALSTGSITGSSSTSLFADNDVAPGELLAISENELSLYFSQGRQLSVDFSDEIGDTLLDKTFDSYSVDEFHSIKEMNDHFVSISSEQRPSTTLLPLSDKAMFSESESVSDPDKKIKYWPSFEQVDDLLALESYALPDELVELDGEMVQLYAVNDVFLVYRNDSKVEFFMTGSSDRDGDGIPAIYEESFGLSDLNAEDKYEDLDGDGLSNFEEFLYSTFPDRVDSDGDGISDLDEVNGILLN